MLVCLVLSDFCFALLACDSGELLVVQDCVCGFYLHRVSVDCGFAVEFRGWIWFIVYGLLLVTSDNELRIVWFGVYAGVGCDFMRT